MASGSVRRYSLSELEWTVTGIMPYAWRWSNPGEAAADPRAEDRT